LESKSLGNAYEPDTKVLISPPDQNFLDARLACEDASGEFGGLGGGGVADRELQRFQLLADSFQRRAGRPRPGHAHPAFETVFVLTEMGGQFREAGDVALDVVVQPRLGI